MARTCALLLLTALALLGVRPAYGADDDLASARAESRAALIEEAKRAVHRDGSAAIAALKRSLAEDLAFARTRQAAGDADPALLDAFQASIEERIRFVGAPVKKGEPETSGALQEAVVLRDWLLGVRPCEVIVRGPGEGERRYPYPPPAPAEAPKPAEGTVETAPKDGAGKAGVPAKDTPGEAEPAKEESRDEKPAAEAPAAAQPRTPEERALAWTRGVRAAEGGDLLDREIRPAHCADVSALVALSERAPVFIHELSGSLQRHALIKQGLFDYNAPSALLWVMQSDEHVLRMQADRPQPALVDDAMVREKTAAVLRSSETRARIQEWSAALEAELDAMVEDIDAWKAQAAILAREISAQRRDLGTGASETEEDAAERARREAQDLPLRLAQARESLATIEITLLYHAAARASVRLEILGRLAKAAALQHRGAEAVRAAYDEALLRLRSTRRLDRLASDRRTLRRWIASSDAGAPAGSREAQRLAAYRAMLVVNEVVQDAVSQRRAMTSSTASGRAEEAEDAQAAERVDEAASPGDAVRGERLSVPVRNPASATWDVKFIDLARSELQSPELREQFDAGLVAAHYAAAGEEVHALVRAEHASSAQADLEARYAAAVAAAEQALVPLRRDPLVVSVRNLPSLLEGVADDFSAAVAGIAEQRERNRSRLRALAAYQGLLREQGTRSLLIRIDRSERDAYFGEVMDDTRKALESAGAWATSSGESHAGGWLARFWPRLLLAILVFVLALATALFARRWVDRRIVGMLEQYPHIGASVREEREEARLQRAEADAAVLAISADDVLQKPAAAPPGADRGAEDSDDEASAEASGIDEARSGESAGSERPERT
ncbi:MAG: hypothetical protein P1V36_00850 [Planctomycetota bacterium]|nr:hypothetical protein [Planctomycetota bacterium]